MKKIVSILLLSAMAMAMASGSIKAQSGPSQAELLKMSKMPPAEQEKYKQELLKKYSRQASQLAAKNGMAINEELLPGTDLQKPVLNARRLARVLPASASAGAVLADMTKIQRELYRKASAEEKSAFDSAVKKLPARNMGLVSVMSWYDQKPVIGLLLGIEAVKKEPEKGINWNNLGGILNQAGLPEKAIPALRQAAAKMPGNSLPQNNLGQAYMALGDLKTAESHFQKSLKLDGYNPESNHAMGMIEIFRNNLDKAAAYFERELEVAQRATTLSRMQKKKVKANLYEIFKRRRLKMGGRPRNFFDEVELEKFEMPKFPSNYGEEDSLYKVHRNYRASVQAEYAYWFAKAPSEAQQKKSAEKRFPIYFDVVEQLIEDLNADIPPEDLVWKPEEEIAFYESVKLAMDQDLASIKCDIPDGPVTVRERDAYQRVCCEKLMPIYEKYMARINSHWRDRYLMLKNRWKDYINQLIYYVSFAPTDGNRILVYRTIGQYFAFLSGVSGAGYFPPYPTECMIDQTLEEARATIESRRNVDLNCPEQLSFNIGMTLKLNKADQGIKLKVKGDCENFEISGKWEFLGVSLNKNFRTGMSTLAFGIEAEGDLKFESFDLMQAAGEGKQEFFIVFDRNNEYADAGVRGEGEVKITIMDKIDVVDIKSNYTVGVNSGYDGSASADGLIPKMITAVMGD